MQNSQEDAQKKIDSRKDVDDSVPSQEFKNWFDDWQNDSENASKVVNALNPAVLPCPALPLRKQKWDIPGLKINKDLMNQLFRNSFGVLPVYFLKTFVK